MRLLRFVARRLSVMVNYLKVQVEETSVLLGKIIETAEPCAALFVFTWSV